MTTTHRLAPALLLLALLPRPARADPPSPADPTPPSPAAEGPARSIPAAEAPPPAAGKADAARAAAAQAAPPASAPWRRFGDFAHGPAFEANLLWPFFPGGLTDLKVVLPALRPTRALLRGEAIVGLHADFGWRNVRDSGYGQVAILAAKLGWRQFFAYGLHLEATVNLGWRQEKNNPHDGTTLDALVARLWLAAGWQVDLTPRVYLNLRGLLGVHLVRIGDRYADTERPLTGGADLNLGVRF